MTITRNIFSERNGTFRQGIGTPQIQSVPFVVMDFTRHLTPDFVTGTRASDATWFDASGTLRTAASNELRYDFDPSTLAPRGLLIEGARTNSLPRNSGTGAVVGTPGTAPTGWSFNNSAGVSWSIVGTGTQNGIPYVDVRWQGTGTGAGGPSMRFNGNSPTIVAASGQTWTHSVFVALVGGSTADLTALRVNVNEVTAPSSYIATGSTAILGSVNATLTRYNHTRTLTNAATDRVNATIDFTFNIGAVVDMTLRIAYPQLEQGAFVSSVIPTDGAAATRAADNATISSLVSIGFNPNEGTIVAEFEPYTSAATNATVFGVSNGTGSTDAMWYFNEVGNGNGFINSTTPTQPGRISGPVGGFFASRKVALAYQLDNHALAVDGTLYTRTGTVPNGLDRMTLGNLTSSVNRQLFGWIRRLTYYPTRLSNAQLQALTA